MTDEAREHELLLELESELLGSGIGYVSVLEVAEKMKSLAHTAIEEGRCLVEPLGCGRKVGDLLDGGGDADVVYFTDQLSKREYAITGFCQNCQDAVQAAAEAIESGDTDGEAAFLEAKDLPQRIPGASHSAQSEEHIIRGTD